MTTKKKSTPVPQPLAVRLPDSAHDLAKAQAVAAETTLPRLMSELLTTWVGEEKPPPVERKTPRHLLKRTMVELPADVRDRVERKAHAEGRSPSEVVARLLAERA